MNTMESSREVFVSYSHRDKEWVGPFVRALSEQGVDVWFDEREIQYGDSVAEAIENALRQARNIVFFITDSSSTSPNLFFELGAALAMKKRVIPIIAAELKAGIPAPVRNIRYLVQGSPEQTAMEVAAAVGGGKKQPDRSGAVAKTSPS